MPLNTSPIKAITKVPNLALKGQELKRDFRSYMKRVDKEISEMGKEVLRNAIIFTGAVATGTLLKSVTSRLVANPSVEGYTREIGFKKPASDYAYYADEGREAGGVPPRSALVRWARAKGIDNGAVNSIRWHIAEYGTEGHNFMEVAEPIIERKTKSILQKRTEQYKKTLK